MQDRKELKSKAREAIRETKPSPVLVTLAVMAILLLTQGLSLNLSGELETYKELFTQLASGGAAVSALSSAASGGDMSPLAWIVTLALDIMTMVINVGYTLYAMRVWRRQNPSYGDVFDGFSFFVRGVTVSILRGILVSLWAFVYSLPAVALSSVMDPLAACVVSLPFLIPMIMVSYSYRLAVYILLDNPDYSAVQCLALSRMAMKGRRKELFLLDLSFLGWALLCVLPPVILWVRPYMDVTCAGWYEAVLPLFWEDMRSRPAPPVSRYRSGGYHVPGEPWNGEDEDEDPDDEDDGGDDA